jgi:lysophospholipase L1-like esterase
MNKLKNYLIALSVTGLAMLIALVVAEFGARYIFRDVTTSSDGSSYFGTRWKLATANQHNRLGFREREIDGPDHQNVFRIAVIGDSLTYGQGIDLKSRFTNRLAKMLNAGTAPYEVLNFGKSGTETVDHIDILQDFVIGIEPDFVLLQWYINDVEGRDYQGRPKYLPLIPYTPLARFLHAHSVLYFLANNQWKSLQVKLGLGSGFTYTEYLVERFGDPDGNAATEAHQALTEFLDLCEQNGIPVGIVAFPELTASYSDYPLGFLLDRVIATCDSRGIPCIDLRPVFEGIDPASKLWVNRFDSHPSSFANDLTAQAIYDHLKPTWESLRSREPGSSHQDESLPQ